MWAGVDLRDGQRHGQHVRIAKYVDERLWGGVVCAACGVLLPERSVSTVLLPERSVSSVLILLQALTCIHMY